MCESVAGEAEIVRLERLLAECDAERVKFRDALKEIARCSPPYREWESTRAYIRRVLGA